MMSVDWPWATRVFAIPLFACALGGCPPDDSEDGGGDGPTVPVSGRVTVDGAGVEGAPVSFSSEPMGTPETEMTTTVGGGIYDIDLPVDLEWSVEVEVSDAICPTGSLDSGGPEPLVVNLPCVSGDGEVEVEYTPVENDCGLPVRDAFSGEADVSTGVVGEEVVLEMRFDDGPEPITVEGVFDVASGTFTGETPWIDFEGGSGRELWDLVLDYRVDVTTQPPVLPIFEGVVTTEYMFDDPNNPGTTFDCEERLDVRVQYLSAMPPRCGNAEPEPGEECDDGNRMDGDGCSGRCMVEGR